MHFVISKYRIALLFVFLLCFLTKADAQLLTYKMMSTENGLPSDEVHIVMQDSKGYIWIGTKNGLCRWDSKNFEYFTIANGLPNDEVLFLYEDSKGRIWISCFSQELCYYFNGHIYNRKNTPFLNKIKNYAGSMVIEQDNELYYSAVDAQLAKLNLLTGKLATYGTHRASQFVFVKDKSKVWAILDDRDRTHILSKNAKTFVFSQDTSYYMPHYLYPNPSDTSVVAYVDFENKKYGFQHGLGKSFYEANYTDRTFQNAIFNGGNIFELYENYIVQKENNRLIKIDNPNIGRISFFIIRKNLFTSTADGLLFCSQVPILEYEHKSRINNRARFLFKYKDDVYIVNNKYQLINVSKQKMVNRLKSNAINLYNLLGFENRFYLTTSFDIYHFADPNEKIDAFSYKIYSNFKYISPSRKKDCFFTANGVEYGISLVNFHSHVSNLLFRDIKHSIYSVYEDSRARLWYSTTNKVYYTYDYYGGVKGSREFVLDAHSSLFCKSILEDNKGNIFFTTNGGVFVYDGKKKYRIDQTNLLSDNECNKVVIDTAHSSFWVATKNGLNQIGYDKEGDGLKFRVLSKFFATDGLRSDNINDILLDSNKLYIGTDKGVNILDKIDYRPDTTSIPVYIKLDAINAAMVKDSSIKLSSLEHDQNNLSLSFSALYFLRRDRLKIKAYLYRNNNLVSQNEITGDKIDYYSLNDGDYKLVLYAFDQDYQYNNGRSEPFIFIINPPYYKTWWFIIGSSLLVIVITTSLLLWSQNRRKKRAIEQAELQAKLNESTLKSLQSQMNPHFVFNSLNTIQSFITEKDEEGAIDYLSDFSSLMREILEQSVHTFITLENEIQFLQQYIKLEMTRYKYSFDVEWNINLDEDDLTDIYIPTMLIQPILENAVKHGVASLNEEKGHIDVSFGLEHEHLLKVVIKDNGKPVPHKKFKGNSIAVKTIKDRLNIYTKNKLKGEYHLQVSDTGATATITIPI